MGKRAASKEVAKPPAKKQRKRVDGEWKTMPYKVSELPAGIQTYLKSPINKQIAWSPSLKCFVFSDGGKRISGLYTKLQRVFCNGISTFGAVTRQLKAASSMVRQSFWESQNANRSQYDQGRCLCGGQKHGSLVDNQMAVFTDAGYAGLLSKYGPEGIDPCTLALIQEFDKRKWVPVAAHALVYSREMGVATAMDLLVWDKQRNESIVVELKALQRLENVTGANGKFQPPLHDIDNSVMNLYQLQTMLPAEILRREYQAPIDSAVMVIVQKGFVTVKQPDAWCVQRANHIYQTISIFK